MPSVHHYSPKLSWYQPLGMHYILLCSILWLLTYVPTIGLFVVAHKEIGQGKSFILFGKVLEKSGKMNSAKY